MFKSISLLAICLLVSGITFSQTIDFQLTNYSANATKATVDVEIKASASFTLGSTQFFSPSVLAMNITNPGTANAGEMTVSNFLNTPGNYTFTLVPEDGNGDFFATFYANSPNFTVPTSFTRLFTIEFTFASGTNSTHSTTITTETASTGIKTSTNSFVSNGTFSGSGTQTLPVSFQSFTVSNYENLISLNWTTSTEKNNYGFEVQRSFNGIDFEVIGFVNGTGNSITPVNYNYIDNSEGSHNETTIFYKLRQIDFDGVDAYTPVRTIKVAKLSDIEWFPNPASEVITVLSERTQIIEIYDVAGKLAFASNTNINSTIPLSELNKGTYFLVIKNMNGEIQQKDKLFIQ